MALAALIRNLGAALIRAVAPPASPGLPATHFDALAKLIGELPVGPLLALMEGRASLEDDFELARRGAALIAAGVSAGGDDCARDHVRLASAGVSAQRRRRWSPSAFDRAGPDAAAGRHIRRTRPPLAAIVEPRRIT